MQNPEIIFLPTRLTPVEARTLLIAIDNLREMGGWDEEQVPGIDKIVEKLERISGVA
jgi:hypothetical protein